jgi:hypothetical protein
MIGESVEGRRPIDPLLIAWAADQRSSAAQGSGPESWVSSDYVRNLATLPPVPGNPMLLGQMLQHDSANGQNVAPEPGPGPEPRPEPAPEPEPQQGTKRTAESAPKPAPETAPSGSSRSGSRRAPQSSRRTPAPTKGAPAAGQVMEPPPETAQQGVTPTM